MNTQPNRKDVLISTNMVGTLADILNRVEITQVTTISLTKIGNEYNNRKIVDIYDWKFYYFI